ncbi:helix-turn-helix domain-containing protein [bacterium]|nr:helix-turn-helix domain-containing protein [bacterium]
MSKRELKVNPPAFIGARDAAKQLGLSVPTLYRYIKTEGLPCFRIGGSYRFRQSELDEWIEKHREPTNSVRQDARSLLLDAVSILDKYPDEPTKE